MPPERGYLAGNRLRHAFESQRFPFTKIRYQRGVHCGWLVKSPPRKPSWYTRKNPKQTLTTPEATLKTRLTLPKRLPAYASGTAIAAVMHIMPTIVPAPKINRYTVAHTGL